MRIFMTGGGTGGHLYPGLAIARAMVRLSPDVVPYFIGARRGIESDILPATEFEFTLLDLHPLYRKKIWKNWYTAAGAVRSWNAISTIAGREMPKAVVGTGGYAAALALAWGGFNRIPIMLHEADSHPGLTTRLFSRQARAVYLGFPEARSRLKLGPNTDVHAFGCPIDQPPAGRKDRVESRTRWGLADQSFIVLVIGGSQGAKAVNEAVAAWVDRGLPDGVGLIWSTGKNQYDHFAGRRSERVRVEPYLSPIAEAYAAADVAVARAGAMSIAELSAWGIPSIFVPLPTAARDHQTSNARVMEESGGAWLLPQSELSAEELARRVSQLQSDSSRLDGMREAMLRRANPNAAQSIASSILETLQIMPAGARENRPQHGL